MQDEEKPDKESVVDNSETGTYYELPIRVFITQKSKSKTNKNEIFRPEQNFAKISSPNKTEHLNKNTNRYISPLYKVNKSFKDKHNYLKIDNITKLLQDKWESEKKTPSKYSKNIKFCLDSSHRHLSPLRIKESSESNCFSKSITPNNSILQTKNFLPKSERNIVKKRFRYNNLINKSPFNADSLKLRCSNDNIFLSESFRFKLNEREASYVRKKHNYVN